jgi:hypothetical protein
LQCPNPEQSAINIAQSAYKLGLPAKSGDEFDARLPYNGLYPFREPAIAQEFPVDPFEPRDSLPTLSDPLINGNEELQPGQAMVSLAIVAADDAEAYNTVLEERHVVDEYSQSPKDYTTPCAETFEPIAWFLWPNHSMD